MRPSTRRRTHPSLRRDWRRRSRRGLRNRANRRSRQTTSRVRANQPIHRMPGHLRSATERGLPTRTPHSVCSRMKRPAVLIVGAAAGGFLLGGGGGFGGGRPLFGGVLGGAFRTARRRGEGRRRP